MKFITLTTIISLLVLQASASFFDDIFEPVQESVGKLVTDVVFGIRETIDCTILAVEQVFSFGGLFGDPSEYEKRCKGQIPESQSYIVHTSNTFVGSINKEVSDDTRKDLLQKIDNSVSEVSKIIQNTIDKNDAKEKIDNVKQVLRNESDRVVEIENMIRQELDLLSPVTKTKFKDLFDNKNATVEKIIQEIGILYKVEQRDKSSAEANKIRHVFDKVIGILRIDDSGGGFSDDDEVKEILKKLERTDSLVDIDKKLSDWKQNSNEELPMDNLRSKLINEIDNIPNSFRDVTKKIFDKVTLPEAVSSSDNNNKNVFGSLNANTFDEEPFGATKGIFDFIGKSKISVGPSPATEDKLSSLIPSTAQTIRALDSKEDSKQVPKTFQDVAKQIFDQLKPADLGDSNILPMEAEVNKVLESTGISNAGKNAMDKMFGNSNSPPAPLAGLSNNEPKVTATENTKPLLKTITNTFTTEKPMNDYNDYGKSPLDDQTLLSKLFEDQANSDDINLLKSIFGSSQLENPEETVKEASQLIAQSTRNKQFMDQILNNANSDTVFNVFENPELLT